MSTKRSEQVFACNLSLTTFHVYTVVSMFKCVGACAFFGWFFDLRGLRISLAMEDVFLEYLLVINHTIAHLNQPYV